MGEASIASSGSVEIAADEEGRRRLAARLARLEVHELHAPDRFFLALAIDDAVPIGHAPRLSTAGIVEGRRSLEDAAPPRREREGSVLERDLLLEARRGLRGERVEDVTVGGLAGRAMGAEG